MKKAQKRKKSLIEKIEGPSAADKLLPRTLEENAVMNRLCFLSPGAHECAACSWGGRECL